MALARHCLPFCPTCLSAGVAHRDIKLENLLLHWDEGAEQPLLKLCDFGYSQLQGSKAGKAAVGTLGYMAPEVLRCALGLAFLVIRPGSAISVG